MTTSSVEDVLPLAPLQEGLLFHALYEQEARGLYLTQTAIRLTGPLSEDRLRRAASALLARHPNLRASFRYRGTGEPVQVIHRDPELLWTTIDIAA
ncbi:MAG: hypothetical protein HOW97_10110, partial [Catenulispora sp.]|nr:hypothetical protein [Catenulispora sp.]